MAKSKGVSDKNHTRKQLDNSVNQKKSNNKACKARTTNKKSQKKHGNECCLDNLEWYCYGNPYDFD